MEYLNSSGSVSEYMPLMTLVHPGNAHYGGVLRATSPAKTTGIMRYDPTPRSLFLNKTSAPDM